VPSARCHPSPLADYIAMKDPVYRVSIHAAFRDPDTFIPSLPSDMDNKLPLGLTALPDLDLSIAEQVSLSRMLVFVSVLVFMFVGFYISISVCHEMSFILFF
jgi:hypothetical protein